MAQKHELFSDELKDFIKKRYQEEYSVSIVLKEVRSRFENIGRNPIVKYLKDIGIYEGLTGKNYLKKKTENHEQIMLERYGVINWGQTKDSGYSKQNKIPYEKISYLDDKYKKYRTAIEKLTRKNVKELKKINKLPKYCQYTGILFKDEDGESNPNDPRKRSIDHKIPIMVCYLNNVSIEEASSLNNIMFVLKYVNSVKGNTDHDSFLTIAEKIRKVFIDEGYQSN